MEIIRKKKSERGGGKRSEGVMKKEGEEDKEGGGEPNSLEFKSTIMEMKNSLDRLNRV